MAQERFYVAAQAHASHITHTSWREVRVLYRKRGGKFGWTKHLKKAAVFGSYQQAELARIMMLQYKMPFRGKLDEAFEIGIVKGQVMAAYKAWQTMREKGIKEDGNPRYITFYTDEDYIEDYGEESLHLSRAAP